MSSVSTTIRKVQEGGFGAQRLIGGDGDDLIYADTQADVEGPQFRLLDVARSAGFGSLVDQGAVAATEIDGRMVFFGADMNLGAGGVEGWQVGTDGALDAVWSQSAQYFLEPVLTGARAVHAFRYDGASWLVTGGWGVSLSRLGTDGRPTLMDTVWTAGQDGLDHPGAFASWDDGDLTILVGGGVSGGLSRFEWTGDALAPTDRIEDDYTSRLSDIAAIETLKIGAKRFVMTLSAGDGGLTVWQDGPAGLTEVDRRSAADDETGFDLWDATSMAVIPQIGQALVYAATARGIMVGYLLAADGTLTRVMERSDVTEIAHARIGGADRLFVSDGGDTVRMLELGAGGALTETGSFFLGNGARAGGLTAAPLGESVLLMAARSDAGGFDLIELAEDGADFVYGGAGDDEIHGGGGNDSLWGQSGADTIYGGGGNNLLVGGNGDDWLEVGDGTNELRGGAGDDQLFGGAGNDLLKGSHGKDHLSGGDGDDELRGGLFADLLQGDGGADLIRAGDGHDTAEGGAGNDVIYGERGFDKLWGGFGDDWIGGGNGDDELRGEGGDDYLTGALGQDKLWGGNGADTLRGGGYADRLWGGAGDDFLFGDEGADDLDGGPDSDRLDGGRGPDLLIGGGGSDLLTGGLGKDRFAFDGASGRDFILDFEDGRDVITYTGGAQTYADLTITDTTAGALVHMGDPFGASVTLVGIQASQLSAADFLFG
jgi:Ca2+-binding RTX toxin-like protein